MGKQWGTGKISLLHHHSISQKAASSSLPWVQCSYGPTRVPCLTLILFGAVPECCWNSPRTPAPPSWPSDLDVLQVYYSWELSYKPIIQYFHIQSCFIQKLFFTAWGAFHGPPSSMGGLSLIGHHLSVTSCKLHCRYPNGTSLWTGVFTRKPRKDKWMLPCCWCNYSITDCKLHIPLSVG